MRLAQYLIGVAIFACFAMVGSWVGFGGGERTFSASMAGLSGPANAGIGRTVFGIGAIMMWLATIGFVVSGARKLLGLHKSTR